MTHVTGQCICQGQNKTVNAQAGICRSYTVSGWTFTTHIGGRIDKSCPCYIPSVPRQSADVAPSREQNHVYKCRWEVSFQTPHPFTYYFRPTSCPPPPPQVCWYLKVLTDKDTVCKGKCVKETSAYQASVESISTGAYLGFCSMKWLGVLIPGWVAGLLQGHTQH